MKCPHCGISFHPEQCATSIKIPEFMNDVEQWSAHTTACPSCKRSVISLASNKYESNVGWKPKYLGLMVWPKAISRGPTPKEVLPHIKADYEDACKVLPHSPKASAALSRRCLQTVLGEHEYKQKNLVDQIDAVLGERDASKSLPSALHDTVDAIRNFGNFSAHPITDATTLQIIDVEPHEAEWCLDILEGLFDHYYVKPAIAKARKAELDKKLKKAKKPPSK